MLHNDTHLTCSGPNKVSITRGRSVIGALPSIPSAEVLHERGDLIAVHEYDHGHPLSGCWKSWVFHLRERLYLHIGEMDCVEGPFMSLGDVLAQTEFGYVTPSSVAIEVGDSGLEDVSLLRLDFAEEGQTVAVNESVYRVTFDGTRRFLTVQ